MHYFEPLASTNISNKNFGVGFILLNLHWILGGLFYAKVMYLNTEAPLARPHLRARGTLEFFSIESFYNLILRVNVFQNY